MMSYKDFCYELAEAIVRSRELTEEEYQGWRRSVLELDGEHNKLAEKAVDIVDSYRSRYSMA